MNLKGDLTYGTPPEPMSEPCFRFFSEHAYVHACREFLQSLAETNIDRIATCYRLIETSNDDEERRAFSQTMKAAASRFDTFLCYHDHLLTEMLLCRYVDNYLSSLSELLALIFISRPETLKGNNLVRINDVLSHKDITGFIRAEAERRVNELAYKGLTELRRHLKKKLGFDLFTGEAEFAYLSVVVEIRNLVTHNRGVINQLVLDRCPDFPGPLGERIQLSREEGFSTIASLLRSVRDIEDRAVFKFNLPSRFSRKMKSVFHSLKE